MFDLRDAWQTHGRKALSECARKDPSGFVRTVASILPKELLLQVNIGFAEMSVEQIVATIRQEQGDKAADLLQQLIDDEAGAGK